MNMEVSNRFLKAMYLTYVALCMLIPTSKLFSIIKKAIYEKNNGFSETYLFFI